MHFDKNCANQGELRMRKLLTTAILLTLIFFLPFVQARGEHLREDGERIFLNQDTWIIKGSLDRQPPYVYLWLGVNNHYKHPKAKSTRMLVAFRPNAQY